MRGCSNRLRVWCLAAWMWLHVTAQVSFGRRSVNIPWVPPDLNSGSENKLESSQASAAAGRTVMQCLGARLITRACHFENVYYDMSSGHFLYFGPKGATSAGFGETHKPSEPWLKLIRGVTRFQQEKENQFFLDWLADEPLPAEADVADFEQPLHLQAVFYPTSIGHLLRDNLQYLIDLPLRFGRDPVSFDWVRWSSELAWSVWEEETSTAEHYRGLYNNRPSRIWRDVLAEALAGKPAGVKYIRFRELIAGTGPADVATHMGVLGRKQSSTTISSWAHFCHPYPFAEMREVAYRNFGMKVAAAAELEPFVLFMDGQPHEQRHMPNAGELIPKLKRTFPGVRMEHVQISVHPLKKQLELLSQATVVITNIGSRSFRLIYLPNGASVILVGPPEFEFELYPNEADGPAPMERERIQMPFQEIEWCWGFIGYVNMLQYHVESEAEVVRTRPWKIWTDARNTDILLDEEKITPLLHLALHTSSNGRAHRGAGTPAAYA